MHSMGDLICRFVLIEYRKLKLMRFNAEIVQMDHCSMLDAKQGVSRVNSK